MRVILRSRVFLEELTAPGCLLFLQHFEFTCCEFSSQKEEPLRCCSSVNGSSVLLDLAILWQPFVVTFYLHPRPLDEAELKCFNGSSSEFLSVAGRSFFC